MFIFEMKIKLYTRKYFISGSFLKLKEAISK